MTDLEICRRIVNIEYSEGFEKGWYKVIQKGRVSVYNQHSSTIYPNYNPLTDDALCFQLMVKYGIELSPLFRGEWCASFIDKYTFEEEPIYDFNTQGVDNNPNKAVCLAIINKHRGIDG